MMFPDDGNLGLCPVVSDDPRECDRSDTDLFTLCPKSVTLDKDSMLDSLL